MYIHITIYDTYPVLGLFLRHTVPRSIPRGIASLDSCANKASYCGGRLEYHNKEILSAQYLEGRHY